MKNSFKGCLPATPFIKKNIYLRISVMVTLFAMLSNSSWAQLSLTNGAPSALINFSNSMPVTVGTNTSTAYAGAGFSPNPGNATPGRLNSNAWAVQGWSDGDLAYAGTRTAASDFTRGSASLPVSTGGFYAYTGAPASVANPTFMIQPGGNDFAPGDLTLRIRNNGTTIITSMTLSYDLFVRNDQSRGNSFNFSYSSDNFINSDVPVLALDYTTTAAPDILGWVQVGASPSRSTVITGIYVTPGSFFYLRWSSNDVNGSLSRDEIGLDNINITATYSGPCSQPATQAVVNSFSNVLSSQMDVNFTRGDGTGGVLIIASTSPTLSADPVSGNTYNVNSNFGNGDPVGGGFVVFRGAAAGTNTASTVTVTGFAPSTTYYFFVFEYDVTVPCYKIPGNSGSQMTAIGSATFPTDYFRSQVSGNWSNSNTWQSSPDFSTWITATLKPTFSSRGIVIQPGHTVTITTSETASLLNISATATLTYTNAAGGGYDLSIADAAGVDLTISGIYEIFGKAPTLAAGATVQVNTAGIVRATANVIGFTSDDFARSPSVSFATGAIFDWNNTGSFQTSSATYFPNATATQIAIFRISQNITSVGANSTTTINGRLEVNGNVTWANTGAKIFRNGIIGTATLTQASLSGPFVIDGTGIIEGTGIINLSTTGVLNIATSSVTALNSDKTINSPTAGGAIVVDGRLNCAAFVIFGSSSFTLSAAATLGMGSIAGITPFPTAAGNIQNTGTPRSFNSAANYVYNSSVSNQVTGTALPLTISTGGSLSISNTALPGSNTVTLTTNNTSTPILNLVNGLFEAGTGQFLQIAATGVITGTNGNQGQSAAAGTIWFIGGGTVTLPPVSLSLTNVRVSLGVSMGGGNTSIKGILEIANTGFVNTGTAPVYSSSPASTLLYTCGCDYGVGEEWYQNTFGTGAGVPYHVTLQAGTSLNFGGTNFTHEMQGDLTISNTSTFALSTVFGGDLNIKGNWIRNATGVFTHNTRSVRFNGTSGTQTITRTGGGLETFAYLFVDKAAGQAVKLTTAPDPTNVAVTGFGGNNILQLINGDLDLNQQTLSFTNFLNTQNNLGIDGTAGNLTRSIINTGVGTGTFAISNADPITHAVTIQRITGNASLLVFGNNVTLTTSGVPPGGGGINFGNTLTTVNGTLQINAYGFVTGFAPTYGTSSFLVYNSAGSFDRNVEWGSLTGPGYPWNVVVQNNTNIRLNTPAINGDADRAIAGNLSIVSGSSLLLSTTALNKLTVGGNLQLNGTLTLPTVFGGDLYVAGNWNRPASGVFTPNDRAVFFYGSANSTITASGGELFPNLFLTKNLLSQTLTLLDDISISKQFDVTTGTFDLAAKNATLVSNATGTASFGKVGLFGDVAYSGAGRFIVERYIPTGVLAGQHVKSWQLLAVPDNGGQTINAGWQEGNLPLAVGTSGLGTIITSNVAGAGFDLIAGVGPSMKSFVPATATWLGVPNTTATALHNKKGYFILVRGDRNVSTYNAPPTPTTLRTTGKLFVPASNPPASTTVLPGKFESIGNPYASAIDFLNIIKPPAPAVDDVFYVWDPLLPGSNLLGGYQTISSINAYKPSPGGTINYSNLLAYTKIQSGQAFLVHSTGAGGTVSFTENAKIAGSNMVYRPTSNTGITSRQYFRASLYTAAGNIADGNVLAFDQSFTNDYEANDALKILNAGENFGIDNDHKILAIEARSLVTRTDTIQYNLGNLRAQTYQFRFGPENMAGSGITAFLEDRFLRTSTLVSLLDSSFKDFSVTGDPASAAADRFRLIFIKRTRTTGSIPLIVADNKPAKSPVAEINTTVPSISVYPNPVVEGLMQVRFNNKTAGNYTLQLTTGGGQLVLQTNVYVSGKSTIRSVKLGAITAGYFLLNVISEKGEKSTVAVLVN